MLRNYYTLTARQIASPEMRDGRSQSEMPMENVDGIQFKSLILVLTELNRNCKYSREINQLELAWENHNKSLHVKYTMGVKYMYILYIYVHTLWVIYSTIIDDKSMGK